MGRGSDPKRGRALRQSKSKKKQQEEAGERVTLSSQREEKRFHPKPGEAGAGYIAGMIGGA